MAGRDWLVNGDREGAATRRIMAAAEALFLARGFDETSAEQIARRAGCSRATLYRIAGGKQALIEAVLGVGAARMEAAIRADIDGLAGRERVATAISSSVAALRRDRVVVAWLTRARNSDLTSSPQLAEAVRHLTGLDDPVAQQAVMRMVLALVTWPLKDTAMEAELVRRFAPA